MGRVKEKDWARPAALAARFLKKRWFIIFVVLSYLFFTAYYMGPSFVHCRSVVDGTGDNTAGPIWRFTLEPNSILGHYEHYTNYPYGETLYSPVNYSLVLQSTLIGGLSKIAGPICGYNLTNIGGFMASSLVMFGFIYALTRRRWVAWLAGYSFAFTPYFQAKVGGHPGYGYEALLVGVMWAFLALLKNHRMRAAITLAVLVAGCFYWDPYFSLLSATVLTPLLLVWLAWEGWSNRNRLLAALRERWLIGLALLITVVLLLPLAYISIAKKQQINSQVSAARGDVVAAAKDCSNYPQEYFLPAPYDPFFSRIINVQNPPIRSTLYAFSKCGIAEDTVGLSWVMISVIVVAVIVLVWEKTNGRRIRLSELLSYPVVLVVAGAAAVGLTAAIIALPPVHLFRVPLPSLVILSLTSTWRILAREYVVVNLAVVVLFSVGVSYFSRYFKAHPRALAVIFVVLFLGMFVQYQAYPFFKGNIQSTFNYHDIPKAYQWIKQSSKVHAIAEYPMEPVVQSSSNLYYLTMQSIYKKPLFNTALAYGPQEERNASLRNLADPQTVPVLHTLGVDTVVVHGVTAAEVAKIPYLKVVYQEKNVNGIGLLDDGTNGLLVVAEIEDAPAVADMLKFSGHTLPNKPIQLTATDWQYEITSPMTLSVLSVKNAKTVALPFTACFDIKMAATGDTGELSVVAAKGSPRSYSLTDQYQRIRLQMDSDKLQLKVSNGHNLRMTRLGCGAVS